LAGFQNLNLLEITGAGFTGQMPFCNPTNSVKTMTPTREYQPEVVSFLPDPIQIQHTLKWFSDTTTETYIFVYKSPPLLKNAHSFTTYKVIWLRE